MNWDLFERVKEVGSIIEEKGGFLVCRVIVFEEDPDVKARFVLYDDAIDVHKLLSVISSCGVVVFTEIGVMDGNLLYIDVWFDVEVDYNGMD